MEIWQGEQPKTRWVVLYDSWLLDKPGEWALRNTCRTLLATYTFTYIRHFADYVRCAYIRYLDSCVRLLRQAHDQLGLLSNTDQTRGRSRTRSRSKQRKRRK